MTNDELIVKHLEGWSGLALESVKYYGETGHVSGSLLLALRGMLVDKENEVKNLALPQVIKSESIEGEPAFCPECNSDDFSIEPKTYNCQNCGHTW